MTHKADVALLRQAIHQLCSEILLTLAPSCSHLQLADQLADVPVQGIWELFFSEKHVVPSLRTGWWQVCQRLVSCV